MLESDDIRLNPDTLEATHLSPSVGVSTKESNITTEFLALRLILLRPQWPQETAQTTPMGWRLSWVVEGYRLAGVFRSPV